MTPYDTRITHYPVVPLSVLTTRPLELTPVSVFPKKKMQSHFQILTDFSYFPSQIESADQLII